MHGTESNTKLGSKHSGKKNGPETQKTDTWMVIDTDMCSSLMKLPIMDSTGEMSLKDLFMRQPLPYLTAHN